MNQGVCGQSPALGTGFVVRGVLCTGLRTVKRIHIRTDSVSDGCSQCDPRGCRGASGAPVRASRPLPVSVVVLPLPPHCGLFVVVSVSFCDSLWVWETHDKRGTHHRGEPRLSSYLHR